jgi:hypothetical protein
MRLVSRRLLDRLLRLAWLFRLIRFGLARFGLIRFGLARLRLTRLPWLAPALLAACGQLPQPFLGNPGATARILAQPPTPRLAVPVPPQALLPDQAAETFAKALANALQNQEVPAVEGPDQPGDWRLEVTAGLHGATVAPTYTVIDPKGRDQGKSEGKPLASADWAAAAPATLSRAATEAAPGIADLLSGIQAAMQHADPNSLYNRPARVQVAEVTGAPGDGNLALTRQMRTMLSQFGPVVQETATGADFIVRGMVKVVPIAGGQERVEIQWSVAKPGGDERGRVVQLNEIPAGSLNGYWGDVASAVAQEAAGGVRDVILRQSGRVPGEQKAEPGAAQASGSAAGQAAPSASPAAAPTAAPSAIPAAARPAVPVVAPSAGPAASPAAPRGSPPPG